MNLIKNANISLFGQNRYRLEVQGCKEYLDVEHFIGREAILQ